MARCSEPDGVAQPAVKVPALPTTSWCPVFKAPARRFRVSHCPTRLSLECRARYKLTSAEFALATERICRSGESQPRNETARCRLRFAAPVSSSVARCVSSRTQDLNRLLREGVSIYTSAHRFLLLPPPLTELARLARLPGCSIPSVVCRPSMLETSGGCAPKMCSRLWFLWCCEACIGLVGFRDPRAPVVADHRGL